ncbi:MAG: hypothetical protein K2G44_07055 [Clostridia bacterium]|nr:hypothetical protein [Clostridia bacterium]
MAYEKRVCVLKQIKKGFSADGGALTGAVYAERLGTTLTLSAKIPAAPLVGGRYCLAVWIDGRTYCFEYETAITMENAPSLARGFAALLLFVKGEAEPVAYGGCGEAPRSYESLLSTVDNLEELAEKKHSRQDREPAEDESAPATFRGKYNDEAIAESDYFALSQSDENDGAYGGGEKQTEKAGNGAGKDEDGVSHLPPRGSLTYYNEVKEKLDEVFATRPRDERLKAIFPMSEWVNSEGALLGIIYEDGTPRYLCVAVEALKEPPQEVKERGVFVPKTQFSDEEGFYVVFQDADTGEYVRVYDV